MTRPFRAPVLALLLAALAAPVAAQDGSAPAPGCAIGVDRDGRSVLRAVSGLAEMEHGVASDIHTVYEAGSVGKQFTAAAVLLLADEGRLSLDDDIRRFLPELPAYGGQRITLRMLLEHASGLPQWDRIAISQGWPRGTRAVNNAHVLTMVAGQPLVSAPGAVWTYNNTGYNLAAVIVERASGESLAAYTQRRIFQPLGMGRTRWRDDFNALVPGRATAYAPDGNGGWRQSMPFENAYGNGGLLTTVDDLMIWHRAVQEGFLNLRARLESPGTAGGQPTRYGLGLSLGQWDGHAEIGHAGSTAGYRAWAVRYPGDGLSVVVLCNRADAQAQALGREAARPFLFPPDS